MSNSSINSFGVLYISQEIEEKFNIMKDDLILNFSECLIIHIKDLNSPKIDIILDPTEGSNKRGLFSYLLPQNNQKLFV